MLREPSWTNACIVIAQLGVFGTFDVWAVRKIVTMWRQR